MNVLVFSDSHGHVQPMLDALEIYRPDAVFHLGDVVRDGEALQAHCGTIPFYQVPGNCDHGIYDLQEEQLARLAGKTIFYLHGHTRRVKLGMGQAVRQAKALQADILLFGHTHCPVSTTCDGLTVVNPGAAKDRRCALLTWTPGSDVSVLPLSLD